MHPAENAILDEKLPFEGLQISEKWKLLSNLDERSVCPKCGKSRKYFCYSCYVPVSEIEEYTPKVNLPLKIDIIKHAREIDGKSTAAHAAVLAPDDVRILTYPCIPTYKKTDNVVLIYPEKDAYSVSEIVKLFKERLERGNMVGGEPVCKRNCSESAEKSSIITKAIFIDSTWNQSKGIYKDKRLKGIPRVILRSRLSQFWRHQKGSPRWYLATIEAVHQFLIELHETSLYSLSGQTFVSNDNMNCSEGSSESNPICANKNAPVIDDDDDNNANDQLNCNKKHYNGEYDNLLFFFRFMYSKIHTLYSHDSLLSYKRPLK